MQGFAAQQPEYDPRAVDDHALVPAGGLHTLQDLAHTVAKMADGNSAPDEISDLGRISAIPLSRQAVSEPIHLAGYIIKDLCESQTLEPSRSSGAEVSLRVVAIDNDRLVRLERCGSLAIELWQWDMYRPGQVLCLVLRLREDFDELCSIFNHMTYLFVPNLRWNRLPPSI